MQKFLLCLLLSISFCAGLCLSSTSSEQCYKLKNCYWSEEEEDQIARCVSVLPCKLETSRDDCIVNTGKCVWSNDQCEKHFKPTAETVHCTSLDTMMKCEEIPSCVWKSNTCHRKPNIILSLADDLGYYDVGWNNPKARTGNLDRLKIKFGISLDLNYASRTCAPSRMMILSGRFPWKVGMHTDQNLNPVQSIRCAAVRESYFLPKVLKLTGNYSTHAFGKWHLGHFKDGLTPTGRGFDSYIGYYNGDITHSPPNRFVTKRCACFPANKNTFIGMCLTKGKKNQICVNAENLVEEKLSNRGTKTTKLIQSKDVSSDMVDIFFAMMAKEVILKANHNQPLFLYMSWAAPHQPVYSSPRFFNSLYSQLFSKKNKKNQGCNIQSLRAHHLGMVMAMDIGHKIIIDALDLKSQFDNTIFVFLSDNGGNPYQSYPSIDCKSGFNWPFRGSKYSWWEGGIRTVGFVASSKFPISKQGSSLKVFTSAVDWRKTLIIASGVKNLIDDDDDGIDLWSTISQQQQQPNELRNEFPHQIWPEMDRYVISFKFQNQWWKIIKGYPSAGKGGGFVGVPDKDYAESVIAIPPELSKNDFGLFKPSTGIGKQFLCSPYCLFNIEQDPQELNDMSTRSLGVLNFGIQLIEKYKKQSVPLIDSNVCDTGYYSSAERITTDALSLNQVRRCKFSGPWLDEFGNIKKTCD